MPELPEVETIKRGLEHTIIGFVITEVEILNPKTFQGDPTQLIGAKVVGVWRRAKVLGIDLIRHQLSDTRHQTSSVILSEAKNLSRGSRIKSGMTVNEVSDSGVAIAPQNDTLSLLFHLKMTGQVIFQGVGDKDQGTERMVGGHPNQDFFNELPSKSTRVIFTFSDGSKLYFNDQRKFGWILLTQNSQLSTQNFLSKLGPEPLEDGFTWEVLKTNLQRRKSQAVKVAILDQEIVSGVGNIYACEACFIAGIHPERKVHSLTEEEYQKLHKGIVESLSSGIHHGGSTKQHYVNAAGEKGYFLDYAFVYDRAGQFCQNCSNEIVKIKLGGRGTYYCPNCQT
jgi:formamidopyrimidine-DNA glycosylase